MIHRRFYLLLQLFTNFANIRCLFAFQRFRAAATAAGSSGLSRTMSSTTTCLAGAAGAITEKKNPLLESWTSQPFSLPPFDKIQTHHYKPALQKGMEEHLSDLQKIVNNPDPPTFANVMVAYDQAGATLSKVGDVFGNMCSSQNTPELQAVQTEMTPLLSRHRSATFALPGLFDKIQAVYDQNSEEELTSEDRRLVERIYLDFTRSGAHFDAEKQKENAEIDAKLASLITKFSQNGE